MVQVALHIQGRAKKTSVSSVNSDCKCSVLAAWLCVDWSVYQAAPKAENLNRTGGWSFFARTCRTEMAMFAEALQFFFCFSMVDFQRTSTSI